MGGQVAETQSLGEELGSSGWAENENLYSPLSTHETSKS